MSIMNSKERRARDRGRIQGYNMCLEDIKNYISYRDGLKADIPDIPDRYILKIMQHLNKMQKINR